jgi:hypothetical protein
MLRGKHWDEGWLTCYWDKKKNDIVYGSPCRPDGRLVHGVFTYLESSSDGKPFLDELEDRGYDIKTLQFSVKRKYKPNEPPV